VAALLNDYHRLLLGINDIDKPISFDIKHRDSFSNNSSNAFIARMAGVAKHSMLKKQLN
jgi:hypothetical protein